MGFEGSVGQRFLVVYSGVLTVAFVAAVLLGFKRDAANATFDQITVHRINVVEPDGTPRLIVADRAEFPGSFLHGEEVARADRSTAGMLFLDDEGTEDGGLIFGGSRDAAGKVHTFGHLSFDRYNQDQTLTLDADEDDGGRSSGIAVNDAPDQLMTKEMFAEANRLDSLAPGVARDEARAAFRRRYPGLLQRAYLGRDEDASVGLNLRERKGRLRAALRVKADGTPVLDFMDANGRVSRELTGDTR
jgi:hypothetical protein